MGVAEGGLVGQAGAEGVLGALLKDAGLLSLWLRLQGLLASSPWRARVGREGGVFGAVLQGSHFLAGWLLLRLVARACVSW
jgi:hypothetical protein